MVGLTLVDIVIANDPELSEQAALIERRLENAAKSLTPGDIDEMLGQVGREIFSLYLSSVGGDSISIWLVDPDKTRLTASYSEPDKKLIGWEQPLNEGLISLVLASEQSLCENGVYKNAQHSKRTDEAMDQITCSMISVPFYLGGAAVGVVSCVQLKENSDAPDPEGFTAVHLNRITRLSTILGRLINYRILSSVLDLEI